MDTAFDLLDETGRSNFLRLLMQSFHCTYACFWSYVPSPTNFSYIGFVSCLRFQDGIYHEDLHAQLPSSSSNSAQRLFHEYRQSIFAINAENNRVPGYAFRNSFPYLEFEELELRRLASNETQRQFYQEARIKTAVFMGCKIGEIELGLSNVPTINTKMEIQSLFFPEDFQTSTQSQLAHELNPMPTDHQNPHSSSSSSLRSLSNIDSPEYSSLLFNIPITSTSTSQVQEKLPHAQVVNSLSLPLQRPISTSELIMPHRQAMQAFAHLRNPHFPSQETEEETMTKAILAVLTSSTPPLFSSSSASASPSSSSSAYSHPLINPNRSAFKSYSSALSASPLDHLGCKKSMFKRSVQFFRSLNLMRNRQTLQIPRPSSTQLHHMMSERKRREKLNESFHALRSLLPPGTKKDKASLLNTTKEYLSSLKAQIDELSRRNKQLEAQVFPLSVANKEANSSNNNTDNIGEVSESSSPSDQRGIDVRLRHVSKLASSEDEAKIVDLQVTLRVPIPAEDLLIRILEFLKRLENVSLMSLEANTNNLTGSRTPINRVILRLRVLEGSEWDESAFQEAVRRVVADLVQWKT